jgi:hypothetical protein
MRDLVAAAGYVKSVPSAIADGSMPLDPVTAALQLQVAENPSATADGTDFVNTAADTGDGENDIGLRYFERRFINSECHFVE